MANNLMGALQDLRKMKRSVKLRDETDPEVVTQTLDTILKEAIAMKTASGGRLGKGAVNELKEIRDSLLANKIESSSNSEFVGKYSAILDQLEEQKVTKPKEGSSIGNTISQNLPSADTFISALTTANPILGYGTKIAKDLGSNIMSKRKPKKSAIQEQFEGLKQEQNLLTSEKNDLSQDTQEYNQVVIKLDLIREQLEELTKLTSKGSSNLENVTSEMNDRTERLVSNTETSSSNLERLTQETTDSSRLQRQESSYSDLRRSERLYESDAKTSGNLSALDEFDEKNFEIPDFGLKSGLGGVIGGLTSAAISKMFAPFMKLWNFIKRGGSILGRLGRVGGITTAIISIYDFVDGFINASDFVEGEASITDRIKAGSASIISGLLSPVDWILDYFDMGFMESKDSFTSKLMNTENELISFLLSPGVWISDYISNFDMESFKEDAKDLLMAPIDFFIDFFQKLNESITGWINEKIDSVKDSAVGGAILGAFDFLTEDKSRERPVSRRGYFGGNDETSKTRTENESNKTSNTDTENESNETSKTRDETSLVRLDTVATDVAKSLYEHVGDNVSQKTSDSMRTNDEGSDNTKSSGGTSQTVVAPTNNQTNNMTNTTVQGGSSSENEDRTWRRFQDRNMYLGI